MNVFSRYPLLALGLGLLLGYQLRAYRREILGAARENRHGGQGGFGVFGDALDGIKQGWHDATQRWTEAK